MKKILALVLLLLYASIIGFSYEHRKSPTANLQTYVGTWIYKTTDETLQIYLKKGGIDVGVFYGECLIGDYSYTKDGVKLDTYSIATIPDSISNKQKNQIIHASNIKRAGVAEPNLLYVLMKDKRYGKTIDGTIELLSPTQIHLKLQDVEGEYDCDEDMPIEGFSIPNDITLTKVTPKIAGRQ